MNQNWYDPILENKERYYRLAYSYVKNEQDALDIVQDSICKALKQKSSLKDQAYIKTWFYRIIVNTSLNFIRSKNKIIFLDDDSWEMIPDSNNFDNLELKEAIESLPIKYKTLIVLRFYEDLKLEQISYILDENISTIKTRLYTALKKLKINMEVLWCIQKKI